jgi:hypothetical protein
MLKERRVGFLIDEEMSGTHEFEAGCGPPGRHPLSFRVTWGARNVGDFLNPFDRRFGHAELEGTITVGGLCDEAPCTGSLVLDYVKNHAISYTLDFEVDGTGYRFVGEKVNIRAWNLPVSHTTCFGTLTEAGSGRLLSRSVTFFRLRTAPRFLASLRAA